VESGGPDGTEIAGSEPDAHTEPVAATAAGDAARSHAAAHVAAVRPGDGPQCHPVPEPGADSEPGAKPPGLML